MKSVPSLVASSTVGVAATGLVFGRPQHPTPARPASNKRKAPGGERTNRLPSSGQQRPATSSTFGAQLQESNAGSSPLQAAGVEESFPGCTTPDPPASFMQHVERRGPALRRRGSLSTTDHGSEGGRKDSMSSRGSWYKRLSIIQPSQSSGSSRSSIGPDSPFLNLSQTSAAPILNTPYESDAQKAPNKLVKRAFSGRDSQRDVTRGGSRKIPTLRRPATSHQRSVTLQQQFREQEAVAMAPRSVSTPESYQLAVERYSTAQKNITYSHYFRPRDTRTTREADRGTSSELQDLRHHPTTRRIPLPEDHGPPTLLKATMIQTSSPDGQDHALLFSQSSTFLPSLEGTPESTSGQGLEVSKRPKRSLSLHFNRLARHSSVRALSRENTGSQRYASAPLPSQSPASTLEFDPRQRDVTGPDTYQQQWQEARSSSISDMQSTPSQSCRSSVSPMPVLSRLSFRNVDTSDTVRGRHTSSSPSSGNSQLSPLIIRKERPRSTVSPSTTSFPSHSTRVRSMTSDRASTLIGSDPDIKEFVMTDDDVDYPMESAFDSYRTAHSSSTRVRSPILESMFDDSPVSATGGSSTITLSDYLSNAPYREGPERIMEEDESMATPKKSQRRSFEDNFRTPTKHSIGTHNTFESSPPSFSLATQKFGRLSLDDDEEDEDWTRDDVSSVDFGGSLSPPSTVNSTRINPAIRMALASSSGNVMPDDSGYKNVFYWSEPTVAEKPDAFGGVPRPRTVHGKQAMDGRGGRVVGRRGPSALHVRSQSVPVVPQVGSGNEPKSKKFGTWGLGGKGVSEDWDNDFDFEENEEGGCNASESQMSNSMLVPMAIQASQANVVGHVGQIREVCLLVEDLKRLRGLAKEKGILHGRSAALWRQAEGIIALAAPDEDETGFSSPRSPKIQSSTYEQSRESSYDSDFDSASNSPNPVSSDYSKSRPLSRFATDSFRSRRGSAFSPDDNIFGIVPSIEAPSLPEYPSSANSKAAIDVARSVMEDIHQHRAVSDPQMLEIAAEIPDKMPFDTTSLRDLVSRASSLSRVLAEIIRKHDGALQSPFHSPLRSPAYHREDRDRNSSPAFTRVFTPEIVTPPPLPRSQSHNGTLTGNGNGSSTLSDSPTRGLAQRMRLMTVA